MSSTIITRDMMHLVKEEFRDKAIKFKKVQSALSIDGIRNKAKLLGFNTMDIGNIVAIIQGNNVELLGKGFEIINGDNLFACCRFKSIDISDVGTAKMTDTSFMFEYCTADKINFGKFDTSNVKIMQSMFTGCNVHNLDLSTFNTSKVTNMQHMFYGCSVYKLTFGKFDISHVTDMKNMFKLCNIVGNNDTAKLDLTSFDFSNATTDSVKGLFENCTADKIKLNRTAIKSNDIYSRLKYRCEAHLEIID
jgi:surface protein